MTVETRSVERAPSGPLAGVASLVWLRSMTACDRVFVASAREGASITYGELRRVASRWSALLEDLGVPPGATVGVAVSDPVEFAMVFLGVLASRRIVAPLNPGATDAELMGTCTRVAPSIVVADRPSPAVVPAEWVTVPSGAYFLSGTPSASLVMPLGGRGGVVLSTSGTTGQPKVIRLDEAQLLHTAGAVAGHLQLSSGDRGFNPLPMFHINAEVVGLLATLVAGATIVLDDRFHRSGFWGVMSLHRVTWINAVPAILARLATLEEGERVPEGIRFARSASAPLPVPVLERFEQVTGLPVVETYGMTEAASQITANPLDGPRKPGSAGVPLGAELRIVMGEQAAAPRGEVGRVQIRGESVICAYASAGYEDRVDADGWLETGDLAYLDDDGYLFLVGRADDVINRGGEKIYPKEVEDAVLGEPGVDAVAVVGADHDVLGHVPVAYLVAGGVRGPADEQLAAAVVGRVQERCSRLLSRPKRPVAYHVVERLPQGSTGKVRRAALPGTTVLYSLLV